ERSCGVEPTLPASQVGKVGIVSNGPVTADSLGWQPDSAQPSGKHPAIKNASYCCIYSCVYAGCLPPAENVANTLANTFRRTVRLERRPLRPGETIPQGRSNWLSEVIAKTAVKLARPTLPPGIVGRCCRLNCPPCSRLPPCCEMTPFLPIRLRDGSVHPVGQVH